MNKKYNVLWIDDECDSLEAIHLAASDFGIKLHGVKNAKKGEELIEKMLSSFDAILLDGKFHQSEIDERNEVINEMGFGLIAKKLQELKQKGTLIPWYILSGQPSFVKEKIPLVELMAKDAFADGKIFDKTKDEESELFQKMIADIETSDHFRIKNKYSIVFEVCNDTYLGTSEESRLVNMIQSLERPILEELTEDKFNSARKVIEKALSKLRSLSLIPAEVISPKLSSLFLAGGHNGYLLNSELLSDAEKYLIRGLIDLTNDGSHNIDEPTIGIETHIKEYQTPFLYQSTVFKLLEFLVWFKSFVDKYPNSKENIQLWSKKEESELNIEGRLQQDKVGNYYIGEYIFNYKQVDGKYPINTKLIIKGAISNTNPRSQSIYPNFVVKFNEV